MQINIIPRRKDTIFSIDFLTFLLSSPFFLTFINGAIDLGTSVPVLGRSDGIAMLGRITWFTFLSERWGNIRIQWIEKHLHLIPISLCQTGHGFDHGI
jgi:hypothetical protein